MSHDDQLRPPAALSACLPTEAREALASAARAAKLIVSDLAREIYLEEAVARVRRNYPAYFRSHG